MYPLWKILPVTLSQSFAVGRIDNAQFQIIIHQTYGKIVGFYGKVYFFFFGDFYILATKPTPAISSGEAAAATAAAVEGIAAGAGASRGL